MQITSLKLEKFMTHDSTEIHFPAHGLVLISGINGSGKSSFIEAVAYGIWGKTLRGSNPWRNEIAGSVKVTANDKLIKRQITKSGKKIFSWDRLATQKSVPYETNSKAQEALEAEIGDMDIWRRTSVFSSSDAAHFSSATDAERKRLLESILGLEKFDAALDQCRRDLKDTNKTVTDKRSARALIIGSIDYEKQRFEEAEKTAESLKSATSMEELAAKLETLEKSEEDVYDERQELLSRARNLHANRVRGESKLAELKNRLAKISADQCPTCGQDIPSSLVHSIQEKITAESKQISEAEKSIADSEAANNDVVEELNDLYRALNEKISGIKTEMQVTRQLEVTRKYQKTIAGSAKDTLDKLVASLEIGDKILKDLEKDLANLEACETVLGIRGVRAHILGHALRGIEAIANMWLEKLCTDPMKINLKSYKESKTGGIVDAISLEVEGAGGGYGYKASSGGERRRIDIAILFALAEVASAAHGVVPGTLWADEVFDALDAEGIEKVAELLQDIATERCVIVITHNPELRKILTPTIHLEVENGKIV